MYVPLHTYIAIGFQDPKLQGSRVSLLLPLKLGFKRIKTLKWLWKKKKLLEEYSQELAWIFLGYGCVTHGQTMSNQPSLASHINTRPEY